MSLAIKSALLNRDVSHITFPDEVAFMPKTEGEKAQTPEGQNYTHEHFATKANGFEGS